MPGNNTPTLNGRTVRCILFDCGETLWTFPDQTVWQSMQNRSTQRAITLLHHSIDQQDFPPKDDDTLALELNTLLHKLIHQFTREHPYDEPDFTHVMLETLAQLGFPPQSNEVGAAVFEALRVSSSQARTLFPDTLTTLASLQERGFILGIVTNRSWGGQPFVEDMRTLGLLAFFDAACLAVSADLGIRKPNPAIFMHALNALQVAPTEAVMVGDSLGADVVGANQLNIFSVWKPAPRMIAEAQATLAPNEPYSIDKHLIPYAHQRSANYGRPLSSETAQPGIIIEHLSELLDIFLEVGEQ